MGKALNLSFTTTEGTRLFHLSTKLDKALRQLRTKMYQGKFKHTRFSQIIRDLEIKIDEYVAFLHTSYASYRPETVNAQIGPPAPRTRIYRGILKEMRESGPKMKVIVSCEELERLFLAVKTTDVLIRVAEHFGLQHYDRFTLFRQSFGERITELERFQAAVSSTAYEVMRSAKKRPSRVIGKMA
jgi:hypothetical protein